MKRAKTLYDELYDELTGPLPTWAEWFVFVCVVVGIVAACL